MKKIIVVDWLDSYGGAERVIKSLCNIFSFKKCYTLINIMNENDQDKIFSRNPIPVQETRLKYFSNKFRYFFLTFHFFIKKIKIDKDVELIISSSHAIAKGIKKTNKKQIHISYFQARNFKYIWSEYQLYFGKLSFFLYPFIFFLRKIDVSQAQNPDFIISNSIYVKEWVKKTYKRDSIVIYPPVDLSKFKVQKYKENFYVTVGRLERYKRFDLVIEAFNEIDKKLIVIGNGSQYNELVKKSNKNIEFLGFLESEQVFKYISRAKGFIHAGIEDFGIAPIEAQACGTPVIGYNKGGLKETVIHNKTGYLFEKQTSNDIRKAIIEFEKIDFNINEVREQSLRFSKKRFEREFKETVDDLCKNWENNDKINY